MNNYVLAAAAAYGLYYVLYLRTPSVTITGNEQVVMEPADPGLRPEELVVEAPTTHRHRRSTRVGKHHTSSAEQRTKPHRLHATDETLQSSTILGAAGLALPLAMGPVGLLAAPALGMSTIGTGVRHVFDAVSGALSHPPPGGWGIANSSEIESGPSAPAGVSLAGSDDIVTVAVANKYSTGRGMNEP